MHYLPRSAVAALAASLVACGGEAPQDLDVQWALLTSRNGLSTNGLSLNGMSTNGMSTNGLSTNGLSTNGLSTNGLSTNEFSSWFDQEPSYSEMVMRYVVRCAVAEGQTLTYRHKNVLYVWSGLLGLAPIWSSGNPVPVAEQELLSACLAAHANKYAVEVAISVRGYKADGSRIPLVSGESSLFGADEGCFFGNLFDGTGVFSGVSSYSPLTQSSKSSLRACAESFGQTGSCAPMVATGWTCQQLCNSGGAFTNEPSRCTWDRRSYRPIVVRIQSSDIATCGNGVCEVSEGSSTCPSDCR